MNTDKKGILALVGCSVTIFWSGAFIFGFSGVMAAYWQQKLHMGRGATGNIMFFILIAVGIFMFLVGRIQGRIGIRRMITIGAIVTGLDFYLSVYATNLFVLYLWAFIMGAASCFIYIPALTTVQRWFPLRRGLAAGVVNLTFGVSSALMAPVFTHLFQWIGYYWMIVYIAVAATIIGAVAAQLTDPPREDSAQTPQAPGIASGAGYSLTASQTVRTRSFWFLWLTWALQGAAGIAMVPLAVAFGLSKGYGLDSAVFILTTFNLTNGLGRLAGGFLSDIIGRNFTMGLTFFFAGVAYFILPHSNWLLFSENLAAVIGLAFGTLFGVSAPLTTDCFGIKHFGEVFGLVFTAYGFIAGFIGPSLSGYVLDLTAGNFVIVFSYLGAFCLTSSVLIMFVRPPRTAH
jgi:MFS transporter, OFA family, oxalate/formate antiporter